MKFVVAALGAVAICRAVSCVGEVPHCAKLTPGSVFFVGEAMGAQPTGRRQFTGNGDDPELVAVRYRVLRSYVGAAKGAEVTVEQPWPPPVGWRGFVEAYRQEGKIGTSVCDTAAATGESLQAFLERRAAGRGEKTSLTVYVSGRLGRVETAAAVTVRGPVERQAIAPKGEVRFQPVPPGRYEAEAEAKCSGYTVKTVGQAEMLSGGCGVAAVEMEGTGRASGDVMESNGSAVVTGALVSFERDDTWGNKLTWQAISNERGRYTVTGLPPGRFRVAVRHPRVPLTTYYPA